MCMYRPVVGMTVGMIPFHQGAVVFPDLVRARLWADPKGSVMVFRHRLYLQHQVTICSAVREADRLCVSLRPDIGHLRPNITWKCEFISYEKQVNPPGDFRRSYPRYLFRLLQTNPCRFGRTVKNFISIIGSGRYFSQSEICRTEKGFSPGDPLTQTDTGALLSPDPSLDCIRRTDCEG